jgi:uncharacterized membrane protein
LVIEHWPFNRRRAVISTEYWVVWAHLLAVATWLGGAAVTLAAILPVEAEFRAAAARRAHFLTSRAMEIVVLSGLLNVFLKGRESAYALSAGFFAMLSIKMALLVVMAGLQIWMGLAWKRAGESQASPVRVAHIGLAVQCGLGALAALLGLGLRAV